MGKSTRTLRAKALTGSLLVAALILMSSNGCKEVVIVSADQTETFVTSNQVFRAGKDGAFVGLGRYQRYRRAAADRIEDQAAKPVGRWNDGFFGGNMANPHHENAF